MFTLFRNVMSDYHAVFDRDPAARGFWGYLEVLLTYSGFHAIALHRFAHALHRIHVPLLPRIISCISRFFTGIEIHPGAAIGSGFFIDHGMGVVVGETADIGHNVSLFQGVTLGGTGKQTGKRHPTLRNNIVVGAGAKVLGNIVIGDNVYIGANAVVLNDVPDNCTVVGVPARVVKVEGKRLSPTVSFDHCHVPDPIKQRLEEVQEEIAHIEATIRKYHQEIVSPPARPQDSSRE